MPNWLALHAGHQRVGGDAGIRTVGRVFRGPARRPRDLPNCQNRHAASPSATAEIRLAVYAGSPGPGTLCEGGRLRRARVARPRASRQPELVARRALSDKDDQGLFDSYPPKRGFDPKDPAWKWIEAPTAAVRTPRSGGIYYAYVNVWSPTARRAQAAVAISHGVKLWVNGELKFTFHAHPPFPTPVMGGRAGLRSSSGRAGIPCCKMSLRTNGVTGFLFRLTDEQGNTLRDIVYARDPELAPHHTARRVHLTVDAPPGTEGRPFSLDIPEDEIPERAIVFAPRTTPFTLASWTDSTLANYSGSALYETSFELPDSPPASAWCWTLVRSAWPLNCGSTTRRRVSAAGGLTRSTSRRRLGAVPITCVSVWRIPTRAGWPKGPPFTSAATGASISLPSATGSGRCTRTASRARSASWR